MITRIPPRLLSALLLAAWLPLGAPLTAAQDPAVDGQTGVDEAVPAATAPVETPVETPDETPAYRLEDADDALFDGDHARALEIYLALAEGTGWTAAEASLGAAKLYATGRGGPKDLSEAARFFQRAFDRNFEEALEAQAAGEAGATVLEKADAVLVALADRFATGEQVEPDLERAVDMILRIVSELSSAHALTQLCVHYSQATHEQARYLPGREFLTNYLGSLTLTIMAGEFEEADRAGYLNSLGEMRRGGADRADGNLHEAKAQPFPVHYGEAVWAYELAAEDHASGTAMYSLGVMHYRAMGFPEYWIDGADSAAVRFRKERLRLEAARKWFLAAILNGDPEGETWFVGVSNRLLDLIDEAPSDAELDSDKQQILETLRAETGLTAEAVSPAIWEGIQAFLVRAG